MNTIILNLQYAFRSLTRDLRSTAIGVLAIAAGVGPNIAVFSVVNAVLLQSLPFRDAGKLMVIYETRPDLPKFPASYLDYKDWLDQNHSFEGMAAYTPPANGLVLVHKGEPYEISSALVSSNLMPLMGLQPKYGRAFTSEDERPGFDQVVILSQSLWQKHFSSDPSVVGTNISLGRDSFTVVGVLDRDQFPTDVDIFLPVSRLGEKDLNSRANRRVNVIGRLKPTVTGKQAYSDLQSISKRISDQYPRSNKNVGVVQLALLDYYTGNIRTVLLLLLVASALVMAIASANVANLLLAGAANRRKEIAIRRALGATPRAVFSQLLTESLLLAFIGTAAGLFIAYMGTQSLSYWVAGVSNIPRLDQTGIDATVLIYSAGLVVLTGLLFGTFPAIFATRSDFNAVLKQGGRTTSLPMHRHLRSLLIISEVAIAVTVLISTGLLTRTLQYLLAVNPGFRTDNVLAVQLSLPRDKYATMDNVQTFYRVLLEKVKALPGVDGVATTDVLPIVPSLSVMHFAVEGLPSQDGQNPIAQTRTVSPEYLGLMNIPVRKGRGFDVFDKTETGFIINETMARMYFGQDDPIGRKLIAVEDPHANPVPVIGVVADANDLGIDRQIEAEMYGVGYWFNGVLLVHSTVDPKSLISSIRQEVQTIDPFQPIGQVQTVQELLDKSLARQRLLTRLMILFAGLALVLSSIGIYSIISRSVADRISEIGLKMALGASRARILTTLSQQGLVPAIIGIAVGVLGARSLYQMLSGFIHGVSLIDTVTYVSVGTLILITSFVAIVMPGLRATRIDPNLVLRQE